MVDSPFTDEQIDFMRADLASDMGYTRMIEATKKRFKKEDRDFGMEFKQWERTRKADREKKIRESNQLLIKEMQHKIGGK